MAAERSLRQREEKLFTELEAKSKELETLKSTTKRISDNGWNLDVLTTSKVNQEAENPQILQMKQDLAKMNARIAEREQQIEKKEQLSEIKAFLNANRDEYEFTLMHSYENKVQDLIDHFYQNERKILSYAEAAKAVEVELEKYEKQKAENVAKSKKGKEFYREVIGSKSPSSHSTQQSRSAQSPQSNATEYTTDHKTPHPSSVPQESPSKPKSIFPPVAKKPQLKLQTANAFSKEVDSSFKHPNRGKSKAEVLQRVIAAFGQNS